MRRREKQMGRVRALILFANVLLTGILFANAWAAHAQNAPSIPKLPKPEVKSVAPLTIRAGRTTEVLVYGENLAPKEVTAAKPPLTVKLIDVKPTDEKNKAKGSKQVSVAVTVPADSARDAYELVLVQPDGAKVNARLFVVEDVAMESEVKKPTSTFAQAMLLPGPSVAIAGALDADNPDIFKFEAKTGQTWDFILTAGRTGSMLDALLRVRDQRHFSLLLAAGNPKQDRKLTFRAPADGVYYIEIADEQAKGGPTYTYRLTALRKTP